MFIDVSEEQAAISFRYKNNPITQKGQTGGEG
jgi:hypothetical protein